jgi:oligo-1,6-glucosidase
LENERVLVILNFTGENTSFTMPKSISFSQANLLIANYEMNPAEDIHNISLRPYEARVYQLNG